jgi:hypothetical protein
MATTAKTKADASRALMQTDIAYLRELEVVNDSDAKALLAFLGAQLKKNKKLRIFVAERTARVRL